MRGECGYCGFYGELVWVHSHYQCPRCKNNIMPCCEGESSDTLDLENTDSEDDITEESDENAGEGPK